MNAQLVSGVFSVSFASGFFFRCLLNVTVAETEGKGSGIGLGLVAILISMVFVDIFEFCGIVSAKPALSSVSSFAECTITTLDVRPVAR